MLKKVGESKETWSGRTAPEIGNSSGVGSIYRQGHFGTIIGVLTPATKTEAGRYVCEVRVSWAVKTNGARKARPHPEAVRSAPAAAQRIVTSQWLDAAAAVDRLEAQAENALLDEWTAQDEIPFCGEFAIADREPTSQYLDSRDAAF
jgi:hypothetical protein